MYLGTVKLRLSPPLTEHRPNRVTTSFTPVRTEADLTLKWMMAGLSDDLGRLEEDEWGNG